jgi:hypothetical protein
MNDDSLEHEPTVVRPYATLSPVTTIEIVIRRYREDQQEHGYRADQLAEKSWQHLVPVCARPYPVRHSRDMISLDNLPAFGNVLDRCPGCSVWMRRNRHTIVVPGEVFA